MPFRAIAAVLVLGVLAFTPPTERSAVRTAVPIDLRLAGDRVERLFAAEDVVATARLLEQALEVETADGTASKLTLVGFRLVDGGVVSTFRAPAFELSAGGTGRLAELGALPGGDFYGGAATIDRSGITSASPLTAAAALEEPARLVATSVAGKPTDWYRREVLVFVAVPADEGRHATALATPVVLFGHELTKAAGGSGRPFGPTDDARAILVRAAENEKKCGGWVQNYTLYKEVEGFVVPEYYERAGGGPYCEMIPYTQVVDRWHHEAGMEPPRWTKEHADGLDLLGSSLKQGMDSEGAPGVGDGLSKMTGKMSEFVRAGAEVDSDTLLLDDPNDRAAAFAEFTRRAKLVGMEGTRVAHLRAEDLGDIPVDGASSGSYKLRSASMWFDVQDNVPLKIEFEVESEQDGNVQPMTIEAVFVDYVAVTEGPMVFPQRTIMRIRGLAVAEELSESERKELRESLAKIKEMEAQMAQLPPSVQKMMKGQIDKLKQMTGDGGESLIEAEVKLKFAAVNEGPPYPGGLAEMEVNGRAFPGAMATAHWAVRSGIVVPDAIGFIGQDGGDTGLLNVSNLGWDEMQEADVPAGLTFEQLANRLAYYGQTMPATVSGGYRESGEVEHSFGPEPGIVRITYFTPTEVGGTVSSDNSFASFRIGHMPCSTQSRSIGISESMLSPAAQNADVSGAGAGQTEPQVADACQRAVNRRSSRSP